MPYYRYKTYDRWDRVYLATLGRTLKQGDWAASSEEPQEDYCRRIYNENYT